MMKMMGVNKYSSITKPGMRMDSGLRLRLHTGCLLHGAKMSTKWERVSQKVGEGEQKVGEG